MSNTSTYKKWQLLWVTTAGTSLVFLDNTIMPVALPTIERELHFSPVGAMWIVNVYLLTLISFLLIGGRLVDLFGKKLLYFLGFSVFGVGSFFGGFSNSTEFLIFNRMLQGMGGALMLPATGALLMQAFPVEERAKALGINTGISSLFLLLGPILGGIFTNYLSWRLIFWVNLPIILYGMVASYKILPSEKKGQGRFHLMGALPLMSSIIALVVALMEGASWGWRSYPILALFGASIFFFALYFFISKKEEEPILDFSIFKQPLFAPTTVCVFMAQMALIVTVEWAVYFQEELHFSAFMTGLIILCATSPVLLMAPLGGILTQYLGPKIPMVAGFLFLIFSLLWIYVFADVNVTVGQLLPGLITFGVGIPLIFSPAFATAMIHIEPKSLGVASSMITLTRQLGSTLGIALMTAVFHSVYLQSRSYHTAFGATLFVGVAFAVLGLIITFFGVRSKHFTN